MKRLSTSRFKEVRAGHPTVLAPDDPAVIEARPIYTNVATEQDHRFGIGEPFPNETVLKDGRDNRKLHSITYGVPIFTVTLRERADCPAHCAQFRSCFGNHMNWARRFIIGDAFYEAVQLECELLSLDFPDGFRIRLHTLGDFVSVEYVQFWEQMLELHPALLIYGYTHWRKSDEIGREIEKLNRRYQHGRFCIRWSDGSGEWSTRVFDTPSAEPIRDGYSMCPHEIKGTSCADCKVCWESPKPIGFTQH